MAFQLPASAYEYLRGKILSGELAPNARIKEQEIATQLNISRTPVREALARLEMEGFVRRSPRRGAVVSRIELDEVDEIYEIRAALESLVARRACQRATEQEILQMEEQLHLADGCRVVGDIDGMIEHTVQFHALLNHSSGSPRLIALLRTLEDRLVGLRHRGLRHPGRPESAMRQHWGTLEGLRRRDSEEMIRWIEDHAEVGRITAIKTHMEDGRIRRMSVSMESEVKR